MDTCAQRKAGGYATLLYPDDFENRADGKGTGSIPVAGDPGDWTGVFFHVEGTPTDYSGISCSGFRVK
ncbi:hypothetical protein [Streptomyces sp. NBC_00344]|uniref:hypothetical protein n=1 Tax=Streptomyces sp. NBC_00344 TaxID=2975720 RepID=UPI002E1F2BAD